MYRCDAKAFQLAKSHKKVFKKMNNFLRTGQKSGDAAAAASSSADRTEHMDHDADCEVKMNVEQPPQPDDAV